MTFTRGACGWALALLVAACVPPGTRDATRPTPSSAGDPGNSDAVAHGAPLQAGQRLVLPVISWGPANIAAATADAATAASGTALAPPAATEQPPIATGAPPGSVDLATCSGVVHPSDGRLVLEGQPVFLFGINVPYLMDNEFPEEEAEPILVDLERAGVNTVRVWFFHDEDPDRFGRLLDAGARHGIRFVVTLEDNVFQGPDWFFSDDDEKHYRPHVERTVADFANRPEIAAWELINEPTCGSDDADCLKMLRDWLTASARSVSASDPCRPVSTGMIGAGNYEREFENYKRVHGKREITLASVHRRVDQDWSREADLTDGRPLFFGEVYDRAYDSGCNPLNGDILERRADRVKDDVAAAVAAGADGYLLWDYAAGTVRRTNGDPKHYCSEFGYQADDPLWAKLRRAGLPPPVPWSGRR